MFIKKLSIKTLLITVTIVDEQLYFIERFKIPKIYQVDWVTGPF